MSDTSANEEPDGFGLNKDARLARERVQARIQTREETVKLEPDFPWEIEPFDPRFFSL